MAWQLSFLILNSSEVLLTHIAYWKIKKKCKIVKGKQGTYFLEAILIQSTNGCGLLWNKMADTDPIVDVTNSAGSVLSSSSSEKDAWEEKVE